MVINKVSQKNKIIVSIIIMLLMPIIMSLSSMAWEGYPDTGFEETYQMCIAEEKTTGDIYAVRINTPGKDENRDWFAIIFGDEITAYYYTTKTPNGLRIQRWLPDIQEWGESNYTKFFEFNSILQSNANIYTDYDKTDVFFSPPPPPITLSRVLSQQPPLTLMTPLIRGISPYLIGLVIASVGFWKGWQFLSKTLRKA